MLEPDHVQIGRSTLKLNKRTCEDELEGKWVGALGCILNSHQKHTSRNGTVFVAPMRVKTLPVHVRKTDFANITSRGGRLSDVYTFLIK